MIAIGTKHMGTLLVLDENRAVFKTDCTIFRSRSGNELQIPGESDIARVAPSSMDVQKPDRVSGLA